MSWLLKSFVIFLRVMLILILLLARPVRFALRVLFDLVLVSMYRFYLGAKLRLATWWMPAKNRMLFPLSTKYIAHGMLILTTLFVATNSLKAREVRQTDFANPSILSALLKNTDSNEIVDAQSVVSPVSAHYAQGIGGISAQDMNEITTEDTVLTSQDSSSLIKPELAGTSATGTPRDNVIYHVVEGGETVGTIAEQYHVSTNTILWENNLGEKDFIKPGQKLTILPMTGLSHRVQSGDTVVKLAQKYEASTDKVLAYNKLADASAISVGDVILIPDGKEPAPPVATPSSRSHSGTNNSSLVFSGSAPPDADVESGGGYLWPTTSHKINQYYSYRHIGLDIDGDYSSPIYASKSGRVIFAGWGSGYGLHIIIEHSGGFSTLYGHSSKVFVKEGDYVKRGQTIAMVGSTGWSTGTHIHFEIRKGPGLHPPRINPLQYIK